MKRILLNIIFTVVPFVLGHSGTSLAQCTYTNTAFEMGEKLTYVVYYRWGFINIKLADVVLWTETADYNGQKVLALKNTSKTVEKYKWIIDVNDYYVSYVEPNTLQPYKHIQKTIVDDYYTDYEYIFDYDSNKIYATIENSKTKKYKHAIDLQPCLSDLLTTVYYMRIIDYQDFKINQKAYVPAVLDTSVQMVYFKLVGYENISVKEKETKCFVLIPSILETSTFKGGETMKVWLGTGKNRIPLKMTSDLKIGKIIVLLEKAEGLRNDIPQ